MRYYVKIEHLSERTKGKSLPDIRCDQCHTKFAELEDSKGSIIQIKCRICGSILRITL